MCSITVCSTDTGRCTDKVTATADVLLQGLRYMSCCNGVMTQEHVIRQGLTGSLCNSSAKPTKPRKLDSRFISAQSLSPSHGRGLGGTSPALIPPVSKNLNSSMSTVLSMLACIGHRDKRPLNRQFIQHVSSLRVRFIQ